MRALALILLGCSGESASSGDALEPPPLELGGPREHVLPGRGVARLPARADEALVLRHADRDLEIGVRLRGARGVAARAIDGGLRFADALGDGEALELHLTAEGVEDWVETAPGARVEYDVELRAGVDVVRPLGNAVEFASADGTPWFRASRAVAVDARGDRRPLPLSVEGCDTEPRSHSPLVKSPRRAKGACVVVVEIPVDLEGPVWLDPLWSSTASLTEPRYSHRVAVAGSGADEKVLVVGGITWNPSFNLVDVVELYDASTQTWSQLAPTSSGVRRHQLTTLADGRVLMTGGRWDNGIDEEPRATAMIFDPATNAWTPTDDMSVPRGLHTATALADGRVLVAGGDSGAGDLSSAEIFDPVSEVWSTTDSMTLSRIEARSILLPSGQVLVASGYDSGVVSHDSSETFDPSANNGVGAFALPRPMPYGVYGHSLALLSNTHVLLTGGEQNFSSGLAPQDQRFDIASQAWTSLSVGSSRAYGAAVSTATGVVTFGGCQDDANDCTVSAASFLHYSSSGDQVSLGNMPAPRAYLGAVLLSDQRAVVVGGTPNGFTPSSQVDVFGLLLPGESCTSSVSCSTNHCVDDVCCDAPCAGECESCLGSQTALLDGTCGAVVAGTDPEEECADDGAACLRTGVCGAAGCEVHPPGDCVLAPCASAAECASGFCVDGLCCDDPCDGTCESCLASSTGEADGVCAPVRRATDPDAECLDGEDGSCETQQLCTGALQCISAAVLCDGFACTSQGCLTACAGDDDCDGERVCVVDECIDASELCTDQSLALGRDGVVIDCAPLRCRADGTCIPECESVDDCVEGLVCDADGTCVASPPTSGGDAGCACATEAGGADRGVLALLVGLGGVSLRRRRRWR